MAMWRITARWSGFTGAPGFTNFYFSNVRQAPITLQTTANEMRTFFNDIREYFPTGLTINLLSDVPLIDEQDGSVVQLDSIVPPSAVIGSTTTQYSGATGAVINWTTQGVVRGRRLRGRTFLVPLANNALSSDGTLNDTARNLFQTAANNFRLKGASGGATDTMQPLVIWSRPDAASGAPGVHHDVTGASVPDLNAVLRSRRD